MLCGRRRGEGTIEVDGAVIGRGFSALRIFPQDDLMPMTRTPPADGRVAKWILLLTLVLVLALRLVTG
jgi:hypothetical protein